MVSGRWRATCRNPLPERQYKGSLDLRVRGKGRRPQIGCWLGSALLTALLSCSLFGQAGTSAAAGDNRRAETGINDPQLDARADALIRKMTLEEKIGQLVQYSAGQATGCAPSWP